MLASLPVAALVLVVSTAEAPDKPVPFDTRWLTPYFSAGPARAAAERFRLDDWRGAASGFLQATRKMAPSNPERLPALTLLALARMNLNDWSGAGALFEELYGKHAVLAPYHAHYAARCRLRRGDVAGALEWAARVPPQSVLEAETVLIKIDAFAASGRWADVEAEAARFLERFPAGPRRAEAAFRRAEAQENLNRPPAEVAVLYRRIWAEAPLELWARRSEERIAALAARNPEAPGTALRNATADEWLTRAMILFERNQSVEAEAAFGAALAAPAAGTPDGRPSADLVCKAQFHRAQSIFKQRQRPRAVPVFALAETACRQAGNRDLLVKALYQGARCMATAKDPAAALAAYAKVEDEGREHSYADDARLRAAELYTDAGDEPRAAAMLTEIPQRYPNGDQLGESLWRLALAAIRGKRWAEAHRWLDENLARIPHEDIYFAEGRALYWKARVLVHEGKNKEALVYYTRAVREYPLSVYALLSLERMRQELPEARRALLRELRADLDEAKAKARQPKADPAAKAEWQFAPRPVFGAPEFRRAVELARMGLGGDARRELARLGFSAPDSRDAARKSAPGATPVAAAIAGAVAADGRDDVFWITAVLLDRGRSWSASHAIPRYSLTAYRDAYPARANAAAWRLSYPRAFPELVGPNSALNHVPETLQLAIMREESTFAPRAESVANALGLTQLMMTTAQELTNERVTRELLLDPVKNVEIGSRLLARRLTRYSGLAAVAIAGYNAGENATDRWLRERGDLELDEFLETIPFDETRNYTKRVLASYITYAWLYTPEQPVPELSFALKPPRPEHVGRPAGRAQTRRPRR